MIVFMRTRILPTETSGTTAPSDERRATVQQSAAPQREDAEARLLARVLLHLDGAGRHAIDFGDRGEQAVLVARGEELAARLARPPGIQSRRG